MESKKLYKALGQMRLSKPRFVPRGGNFFPHQCLGAECAAWSVRTAVAFIDAVYDRLGVESPLTPYRAQFEGL